jgi:CHAT domain-containing protein/Flp pilus assembly protein TadD
MRGLFIVVCGFALPACQNHDERPASTPADPVGWILHATTSIEKREFDVARSIVESALAIPEPATTDDEVSQVLLAWIMLLEGDYENASTSMGAWLAGPPPELLRGEWAAKAHQIRGRALIRLGSYRAAIEHLEAALEILELLPGNLAELGTVNHYRGLAHHERGELADALTWYGKALELRERGNGRYSRQVAATYNNLGNVYWRLGDYLAALEMHEWAMRIKVEILSPTDSDIAVSHANLANLRSEMGQSDRADYHFRLAVAIHEQGYNKLFLAKAYNDFGSHLWRSGEIEEAGSLWTRAIGLYRSILSQDHSSVGLVESNMAAFQVYQGDIEGGKAVFESAIQKVVRDGRPNAASAMAFFASALRKGNQIASAEDMLEKAAEEQLRQTGARSHYYLDIQNDRADFLIEMGSFLRAQTILEEAIQTNSGTAVWASGGRSDKTMIVARAVLVRSVLLWSQSVVARVTRKDVAVAELHELSLRFDAILRVFGGGTLTIGPSEELEEQAELEITRSAVVVASVLSRKNPSVANLERALRFMELGHQSRLKIIMEKRALDVARIPHALQEQEHRLRDNLLTVERDLDRWQAANPTEGGDNSYLNGLRFAFQDSLQNIVDMYSVGYPDYYAMRYSRRTASIPEVREALGADREMIEYTIAGDSLYAFVLSPAGNEVVNLGETESLEAQVSAYVLALQSEDQIQGASLGMELYQRLLAPIAALTTTDRWVVVPDGPLLNLPFEALIQDNSGTWAVADAPYLILDKSISYAYSATLFADGRDRESSEPAKNALFLSAPVFSGGVDVPSELLGMEGAPGTTHFEELRGTGREAVGLDRLFDRYRGATSGKTDILLASQASEEALKNADLSDYRFLHLATHGYTNPARPSLSGLLFGAGRGEDGVLHVGEVLGLNLNAEMVVLSACRSGVDSPSAGEGLIGLSRAFMYAGTTSVVASFWNANDSYTAALMGYFYEGILTGLEKAEALRAAKLRLMEDPSVASRPGLWAAFVLIGQA